MSDFFLNLKDKPRVVDFLVDVSIFADAKGRATADTWVKSYQDGEHVPTDKLADAALQLAMATWPQRFAVQHYLSHEGADEEWKRVTSAVRPSTSHLMVRFRQDAGAATLDELLHHSDVGMALHDEELSEIAEVRMQVRHDVWKEKAPTLTVLVKNGADELAGYRKRFEALRELAYSLPRSMQDEVFSKIMHYEDRIFFAGEVLPVEILDDEIKYYREQKEISPLEG